MNSEELRLKPDLSIVFEKKDALKRPVPLAAVSVAPRRKRPLQLWGSLAAAAVVAMALLLSWPSADMPPAPSISSDMVAQVEPPVEATPVEVVEQPAEIIEPAKPAPKQIARIEPVRAEPTVRPQPLEPIGAAARPIAMTLAQQSLTLEIERKSVAPQLPVSETLRRMAIAAIERERPSRRRLLDDLGEKSIIAYNTLIAKEKTMVTKTYDTEGNLTDRQVTSLGLNMNRNYE